MPGLTSDMVVKSTVTGGFYLTIETPTHDSTWWKCVSLSPYRYFKYGGRLRDHVNVDDINYFFQSDLEVRE